MSDADPISKATTLPRGAVFHRCALQVNPHRYAQAFRGRSQPGGPTEHAREVVDKAVELGVSVLAITDHNDVSGVPAFQVAADDRGVHILPGFELESTDGVHVLCIYPPAAPQEQLERFLGAFGIIDTEGSSGLCDRDFVEVVATVHAQGGVSIAAHVTSDKGLLKQLTGQSRVRAWRSHDLLAIQIPGPIDDLPQGDRDIVRNRNPDYEREHLASEDLAVAVVNAKDVVEPADLEDRAATCWIKMSEVTVEGLRQAFLDPGSRIRLNPPEGKLEQDEHAELVAIAWEGGFLDGQAIHFNPNLNVLIGGRGTGKSTVVESIRAVLGLDPIGDEAAQAHQGVVRHVLKSGTKVSLLARAQRPAVREYRIERTIPNPPIVKDSDGRVSNLSPEEVLPRIEVFGQHEISELTRDGTRLTRLLDRFLEPDESLSRRKEDLRHKLEKNRRSLLDAREELTRIDDRLAALPGIEETLKKYKEAGLEDRLKEQSLVVREQRLLDSVPERIASFRDCLSTLEGELPIDRVFLSEKALEELPGREILGSLNPVLERLDSAITRIRDELTNALQQFDQGLNEVREEWEARRRQVQAEYEKILRDLQKSRVDGEEFIRLRKQIEALRPLRERREQVSRLEREHAEMRARLLADWEDLKAEEFRRLDGAAKKVRQALKGRVQVEVTASGDREELFRLLRDEVGGRLSEAIDALRGRPDLSLPAVVAACRSGPEALSKAFGMPSAQASRLAQADREVLMKVEELDLPATTSIQLNTAVAGEPPAWQPLEELSKGQKATAVLLLLLLESDAPLIVDQPEDDLDNRFITEGVVPRMREEKQRRQFVFSTHNANIPVLGDAELIIGLSASGEADQGRARIDPTHMGSIDSQPVRELVEEILEGGKDAFERRRRKYGF
ncbi:MAG TPA: PHP domain-containing protein [Vicinamibacteria bacterium]